MLNFQKIVETILEETNLSMLSEALMLSSTYFDFYGKVTKNVVDNTIYSKFKTNVNNFTNIDFQRLVTNSMKRTSTTEFVNLLTTGPGKENLFIYLDFLFSKAEDLYGIKDGGRTVSTELKSGDLYGILLLSKNAIDYTTAGKEFLKFVADRRSFLDDNPKKHPILDYEPHSYYLKIHGSQIQSAFEERYKFKSAKGLIFVEDCANKNLTVLKTITQACKTAEGAITINETSIQDFLLNPQMYLDKPKYMKYIQALKADGVWRTPVQAAPPQTSSSAPLIAGATSAAGAAVAKMNRLGTQIKKLFRQEKTAELMFNLATYLKIYTRDKVGDVMGKSIKEIWTQHTNKQTTASNVVNTIAQIYELKPAENKILDKIAGMTGAAAAAVT